MNIQLQFTDPERAEAFQAFCDKLQATPDEVVGALVHLYIFDAIWFHRARTAKGLSCHTRMAIHQLRNPTRVFPASEDPSSPSVNPSQEDMPS